MRHSHVETMSGPKPRAGPALAAGGSGPPGTTRGGPSIATSHKDTLSVMQWNAEGVRQKKLDLQNFLDSQGVDVCCIQESHNRLLLNRPEDQHTYYSRAWRKRSTPDLALATDNVQKKTRR